MDNRELESNSIKESLARYHFKRPRLNKLFTEASRFPVVLVCAGAGYGKTTAVHDFIDDFNAPATWIQLSEIDNVKERFWENIVHSLGRFNMPFSDAIKRIGFPNTTDKQNQYFALVKKYLSSMQRRTLIMDDVHVLENPAIVQLSERMINNVMPGTTLILISRSTPRQNITSMISKGKVFNISEDDLRFTDNELANYLSLLDIHPPQDNLRDIMQDTGGWAFAINLIARSFQKAPSYKGYLRSAIKMNIFHVMEIEIWSGISEQVQRFLVHISLIGHLSYELIELLALGDKELIDQMERQNAYIRRDSYINAYIIHPLFLEFLKTKQEILSEEQKRQTYTIAMKWCNKNGFNIDALSYCEKMVDYEAFVSVMNTLPAHLPYDVSKYAVVILERAPAEAFDKVTFLAVTYMRCLMRTGNWQQANELAEYYVTKFLKLPENDVFRNRNIAGIYLVWAYLRNFMCLFDHNYDFDKCFKKFRQYFDPKSSIRITTVQNRIMGPWVSVVGSSKKGAPEDYIKALSRSSAIIKDCIGGFMEGEEDAARGELKFYQGDTSAAEAFIDRSLKKAKENHQFEIQHRVLLYILRISIAQGNYEKVEHTLKEMKSQFNENDYYYRYVNHDISLAWYYYLIDLPENFPDWIKQNISPYGHPSGIENFENQIKVRYRYLIRDYPPLLAYFHEIKGKKAYLYGQSDMLAIEACVHYKMKDKAKAFMVLHEAYKTTSPNDIIMPFIEMGKDMRTLTTAALKEQDCKIPKVWLENINRKSASYAKQQSYIITKYRQINCLDADVFISPRESDILRDLSHGLSRAEIASNLGLSINTVKMFINNIYSKLGAENFADLIRIATERNLI